MKTNKSRLLIAAVLIAGLLGLLGLYSQKHLPSSKTIANDNTSLQPAGKGSSNNTTKPNSIDIHTWIPQQSVVKESAKPVANPQNIQTVTQKGRKVSFIKDQLVLKTTRGAKENEVSDLLASHNMVRLDSSRLQALNYVSVKIPEGMDIKAARTALTEDPQARLLLKAVEPNYIASAMTIEDPLYPEQWYIGSARFDKAWDLIQGTSQILVAVVDTGVDSSHPDLLGRCAEGISTIANDEDAIDRHGHGTFTAGLIAGAWDTEGIRGACPANVKILPVKSLDATGQGTYEDAAEGIVVAADSGARVINLGFGGYAYSELLKDAVDYAIAKGCVVVAAGGNDGADAVMYPAGYPDVIGVGALGKNNLISPFSNRGMHIDVVAPGEDVLSTSLNGTYQRASGSSCASALVSGLAAIFLEEKPGLSAYACMQALSDTADDLGAAGRDQFHGAGLINASNMLTAETKAFHDLAITGISFDSLMVEALNPMQILVNVRNNGTFSNEVCDVVLYRIVDGQKSELGRQKNVTVYTAIAIVFDWVPEEGENAVAFQAVIDSSYDLKPENNSRTSGSYRIEQNGSVVALHKWESGAHQWFAGEAFWEWPNDINHEIFAYIGNPNCTIVYADIDNVSRSTANNYSESKSIIKGAKAEDTADNPFGESGDLSGPFYRHFWNRGLEQSWSEGGYAGYDSAVNRAHKYWTGGLGIDGTYDSDWENGGGIKDQGVLYLYQAGNKELAYKYLGHIVHLLTDMSVPAHVLGDGHPPGNDDNFEEYLGFFNLSVTNNFAYKRYGDHGNEPIAGYITTYTGNQDLYDIFYDMAEFADNFESDGEDGGADDDPTHDNAFGEVSWTECATHQAALQPKAILQIAALYKWFWEQTAQYREIQVTVSASPVGKGLKVKVDGVEYTESKTFTWQKGEPHTIEATFAQNGYNWESWSDVGDSENTHTVTPQVNAQYVASFSMPTSIQLTGIAITGPSAITENGSGAFSATAYYSDDSSANVTPNWSENSSVTSISSSGTLSAGSVSGNTLVTVTASYTAGGITKTSSASVTIVNAVSGGGSQTVHALANGTFESGTASWGIDGTAEVFAGSYPHGGSMYAYLCNANNALGSISQFFPVPAGTTAATLSFYLNVSSEETAIYSEYDTMNIDLVTEYDEFIGTVAQFSNLDKRTNGSYVLKNVNIMPWISAYKGQSIFLVFHGETDDSNTTIFRIDDVDVSLTVDNPITLTGLSIRGPSSIPENLGGAFYADAYFSDGTIQTVSASSWSENSTATTFSSDSFGFLFTGSISADTVATLTATYSFNGVTKQATKNVTVVESTPRTFTRLSVTGPSSIDEFSTGQYQAEAFFSDGTSQYVSASWSENSSKTTISGSGLLYAGEVSGDLTMTVSASYTSGGVTRIGTKNVTVQNVEATPTLMSISISGNTIVNESSNTQYMCIGNYSDGSQFDISSAALWYDNSAKAAINGYGFLTTSDVQGNQPCRITATYGGRSATYDLTIKDVTMSVAFDVQGGAGVSPSSKIVTIGSVYGTLPTTTLAGYTFCGWWTGPNGTGVEITSSSIVNSSYGTLYVQWLPYLFSAVINQIVITKYTGSGGLVVIPSLVYGKPVTDIGDHAFANCTNLTSVVIPDSVTRIGGYVFTYCSGLTNAVIGNSVTNIGQGAFRFCTNLTSVIIPNNVTSIGREAFAFCSKLTSVVIPDSVTRIEGYVFTYCSGLTNAVIGNSVTSIGLDAFRSCTNLTSLSIPNSVTNIGSSAFVNCSRLSGIYFRGNAPVVGTGLLAGSVGAVIYYSPGSAGWAGLVDGKTPVLWDPQVESGTGFGIGGAGQFGFTIRGTNKMAVAVESCTNLTSNVWIPVKTVTLSNGTATFIDTTSTNHPSRFYRFNMP